MVLSTPCGRAVRARVLIAKIVVAAGGGVVFGVVAALITTGIGLGYVAADGYTRMIAADRIVRYGAGAAVGAGLLAAVGASLGSLLRSQLGAIITVSAWGFGVEQLLGGPFDGLAPYRSPPPTPWPAPPEARPCRLSRRQRFP